MATWWVTRYNTRRRQSAIGNITPNAYETATTVRLAEASINPINIVTTITGQGPPRLTLNTQQPKRLLSATETLKT